LEQSGVLLSGAATFPARLLCHGLRGTAVRLLSGADDELLRLGPAGPAPSRDTGVPGPRSTQAPGRGATSTASQGVKWGAIVSRRSATQSLLKRSITGIDQASKLLWPTLSDRQGLVHIERVEAVGRCLSQAYTQWRTAENYGATAEAGPPALLEYALGTARLALMMTTRRLRGTGGRLMGTAGRRIR
jgi:hypothetical protein